MIRKFVRVVRRLTGRQKRYPSETSKVRHLVLPFLCGKGCDIGFGGDKVTKDCVGIDLPRPYAHTGGDRVDVPCDVMREPIPLPDGSFDFVYSSHLIEDFADTGAALREFTRLLRNGGVLALVFPDEPTYRAHCRATGTPLNTFHVHADMGLAFMQRALHALPGVHIETLFASDRAVDYNVVLVVRVHRDG